VDFIAELLIQFVLQVVFEILGEFAFEVLAKTRWGRWICGTALGLVFGGFWGDHLSGGEHWPKLLWVSAAMAVVAFTLCFGRRAPENDMSFWGYVTQLPWEWSFDRLLGFGLINVGIAAGILVTFPV
jgi:hypothetical protein